MKKDKKNAMINKILIWNLSASDFLVGVYTMTICVKSVTMQGKYCKEDVEWRSGITCSAIGALLMIGTESSVFTLTIITGFRVYTLLRPFVEVRLRTIRHIIVLSWTLAIAIAVIPLLPVTEDYFVDNVWLSQNPFFSIINKNEIKGLNQWISTIQTENNDTLTNSTRENKALTNQQLKERAKSMQKKVTVIIITDLLCWMPICIMGFLQVAGNYIARKLNCGHVLHRYTKRRLSSCWADYHTNKQHDKSYVVLRSSQTYQIYFGLVQKKGSCKKQTCSRNPTKEN
uniref:lutropin-choriogonadotropic hormone receptor-like isoform X7 n=1 Tax=Styela clava TaxID=7725 RepID=UPI001939320B|nr:lutropin-choriogonadotropic hormone receptor-like isoform X7 [Styela clava]